MLLTTFDLWLDALRFIRLSLQPNIMECSQKQFEWNFLSLNYVPDVIVVFCPAHQI